MRRLLVVLAVLTAVGLSVAYATSLGVSSQRIAAATRTVSHGTCTLAPAHDAFVDESHAGTNYGTNAALVVSPTRKARSYTFVRFDLSGCSFPAGYAVDRARVTLTVETAPASTRTLDLDRAAASWGESTIKWNNQPAAGAATASTTAGPGSTSTSFPVTSDVIAFLAGTTNNGWRISDPTTVSGQAGVVWGSGESTTGPRLTVDYVY